LEPDVTYTAQHIFQGETNLAEDRYVNVFRFMGPDTGTPTIDEVADSIKKGLQDFYTGLGPASNTVLQFLSPVILGTAEIRVYDDSDAMPREPTIRTYPFAVPSMNPLPSEVALCLSMYGNRNLPRERGRVFLGPLNTSATATGSDIARPATALVNALAAAGTRLAVSVDSTGVSGLQWAIRSAGPYSDGTGAGVITHTRIRNGWVDNAFDTQRRRGAVPSARTLWTIGA
jgi:hypothetical protein